MSRVARWWPVCGSILVMSVIAYASTLTPAHIRSASPPPAPVVIPPSKNLEASSNTERPIFSAPETASSDADSVGESAKLPSLVGIASGRGTVVALLKGANGQIVPAHIGDLLEGWTVRTISPRAVTIENLHGEQELKLTHNEN